MDLRMRQTSVLNIWPRVYRCVNRDASHFLVFPFYSICFQQQVDPKNPDGEKAEYHTRSV